jgi:hypothetical protein
MWNTRKGFLCPSAEVQPRRKACGLRSASPAKARGLCNLVRYQDALIKTYYNQGKPVEIAHQFNVSSKC